MKRPLAKLAAITSSVVLVAGFVSYRAGAFDWLMGTSAKQKQLGSSKLGQIAIEGDTTQSTPSAAEQSEKAIMDGSKSGFVSPSRPASPF